MCPDSSGSINLQRLTDQIGNAARPATANRDRISLTSEQGSDLNAFCPIAIRNSHKLEIYLRVVISYLEVITTLYSETSMLESNQVESCANHSAKPTVFILRRIR